MSIRPRRLLARRRVRDAGVVILGRRAVPLLLDSRLFPQRGSFSARAPASLWPVEETIR